MLCYVVICCCRFSIVFYVFVDVLICFKMFCYLYVIVFHVFVICLLFVFVFC